MGTNRGNFSEIRWPLLFSALFIAALGVYNLHSSAAAHEPELYLTQLVWLLLGLGVVFAALTFDYRVSETFAYLIYIVICLALVAVLVKGRIVSGAQRWLGVGPLVFQPSEFAKLATVFCLARYFSQRLRPEGYSIADLFRPFNLSRPLILILALIFSWRKPWLVDPLGELARFIHFKLEGASPVIGNLIWFRVFLIIILLSGCVGGIIWIIRVERLRALLDPWPLGRRTQLILLCMGFFMALGIYLGTKWSEPVLRDPFGVAMQALNVLAAPGGPYEFLHPSLTLRLLLATLFTLYLVVSLFLLRREVQANLLDIFIAPIDLLGVPAVLVLIQPDLGTAGIIVLVGLSIILVVGVRLRSLLILSVMAAMLSAVGWFGILKDYQKRRILTFIDPEHDLKGAGWNAVQSLIAVGSGKWLGKGHLGGTQTQLSFLPEQHTDFAFSVWSEEQGLVGCAILLLAYFILLVFSLSIAKEARDTYGALLVVGISSIIFWQTVINIGMVSGVVPVVGLTLPLFSYGGSSVLTIMLGIGLLLNVHLRRKSY